VISEGLFWGLVRLQFGRNLLTFRLKFLTFPYCISLLNSYCKPILPVIYIIFILHPTFLLLRFSIARPSLRSYCRSLPPHSRNILLHEWLILYPSDGVGAREFSETFLPIYLGADKSLARPGRKQATATKL